MGRLAGVLFSIVGTSLAGSFLVAALVMGYDTVQPLVVAVALGALLSLPVTYLVTKAIMNNG